VVDNLEAPLTRGIIRAANVDEGIELALHVVLQERQHIDNVARLDEQRQVAKGDDRILDLRVELFLDVGRQVLEGFFVHFADSISRTFNSSARSRCLSESSRSTSDPCNSTSRSDKSARAESSFT